MHGQLRPDPEYLTLVGTPDVAHFSFTIFVGDNTNRIRKPLFLILLIGRIQQSISLQASVIKTLLLYFRELTKNFTPGQSK
jgi:hypothetical protein